MLPLEGRIFVEIQKLRNLQNLLNCKLLLTSLVLFAAIRWQGSGRNIISFNSFSSRNPLSAICLQTVWYTVLVLTTLVLVTASRGQVNNITMLTAIYLQNMLHSELLFTLLVFIAVIRGHVSGKNPLTAIFLKLLLHRELLFTTLDPINVIRGQVNGKKQLNAICLKNILHSKLLHTLVIFNVVKGQVSGTNIL